MDTDTMDCLLVDRNQFQGAWRGLVYGKWGTSLALLSDPRAVKAGPRDLS
jgi:hypothetical protein